MSFNDDFVNVLTDTFSNKTKPVTVNTSIRGLEYRVEILYGEELVDALEVSCAHLRSEPDSDVRFAELYNKAHNDMVYQHSVQEVISNPSQPDDQKVKKIEKKDSPTTKDPLEDVAFYGDMPMWVKTFYRKIDATFMSRHFDHRLVALTVLVLLAVCVLFLVKIFLCSDYIVETFIADKQDKVSYLERTEFICNKLEKKCKTLAKGNRDQTYEVTVKQCREWCEVEVLDEEVCAEILPYFPSQKVPLIEQKEMNSTVSTVLEKPYKLYPEGEIELFPSAATELYISNQTEMNMSVTVVDLSVEQTHYDEIVQFRKGISVLQIVGKSEKAFKIFLEPTYYEAFKKGRYSGYIEFELHYKEKKKENIRKVFFFEVK